MSKDDDSAHEYYAMDITKAQYVDVNVYPKGTLTPLNKIELPVSVPVALTGRPRISRALRSASELVPRMRRLDVTCAVDPSRTLTCVFWWS
jgi:hypothetical protein